MGEKPMPLYHCVKRFDRWKINAHTFPSVTWTQVIWVSNAKWRINDSIVTFYLFWSWKCILVVTWAAFISITQVSCFFFRKPCTACSSKKWTRLFTSPSSWVSTIALTITPFSPIRPTSIYRNFGPRNKLASEAIIIVSSVSSHWLTSLMFKYCNFFKTNHRGLLLKKA